MTIKEKYYKLDSLLGACFNQDWDLDYDSPEAVIKAFAHMGGRNHIKQTILELKTLLKEEHSLKEWEKILYHDFSCEYRPDYKENLPKQWLEKVLKQFEDELLLAKDD